MKIEAFGRKGEKLLIHCLLDNEFNEYNEDFENEWPFIVIRCIYIYFTFLLSLRLESSIFI